MENTNKNWIVLGLNGTSWKNNGTNICIEKYVWQPVRKWCVEITYDDLRKSNNCNFFKNKSQAVKFAEEKMENN